MRVAAAIVLVSTVVGACGARTPLYLDDGTGHGDDDGDDDGGLHADADAAMRDESPAPPPKKPTHVGYVAAIGDGAQGAFAVARFYPETVDPVCAYLGAVGTCSVVSCFTNTDAPPSANAGPIDVNVSSTSDGTQLVYAGTSPTGTYFTASFASASALAAGTAIEFIGEGATDVPGFDIHLTAPPFGNLTMPVLQVPTTIDTTQDLPLAWDAIDSGDAIFALSPPTSLDESPTLVCFFDGSAGAGIVPHAQLQALKHMAPGGDVEATFLAMGRASVIVGTWTVSAIAVTEDGISQQSGMITLE